MVGVLLGCCSLFLSIIIVIIVLLLLLLVVVVWVALTAQPATCSAGASSHYTPKLRAKRTATTHNQASTFGSHVMSCAATLGLLCKTDAGVFRGLFLQMKKVPYTHTHTQWVPHSFPFGGAGFLFYVSDSVLVGAHFFLFFVFFQELHVEEDCVCLLGKHHQVKAVSAWDSLSRFLRYQQ